MGINENLFLHYFPVGLPFLISAPHFLDVDQAVVDGVEGLTPDKEKHDTYMFLSPVWFPYYLC